VAGPTTEVLIDVVGYIPPTSPVDCTATVNLTAGQYYVTGDLTVRNQGLTGASDVFCSTYVNSAPQSTFSVQTVPTAGSTSKPGGYGISPFRPPFPGQPAVRQLSTSAVTG